MSRRLSKAFPKRIACVLPLGGVILIGATPFEIRGKKKGLLKLRKANIRWAFSVGVE
jgi:hypothetical protein